MAHTVLIVEDSPQTAANLEIALLGVEDIDVRIASSGIEAMGMIEGGENGVKAVITDLEMPRMDGYELIRRLRALPAFRTIPIIVASGSPEPDWPDRAIALGADACFAKPYSPIAVRKKLESLLSRTR